MGKIIKMKLEAIEKGQFEIEEMTVSVDDGKILEVIPAFYYEEYKGYSLYIDTCEVGKRPVLGCALAIFNLELPALVTDTIDWVDKDYDGIDEILFYPVIIDVEYEGTMRNDLAVRLNKKEYYLLYRRYGDILGIRGYCRDELSGNIFFLIELYDKDWSRVFRTKKPICTQIRSQIEMWKRELSFESMVFTVEYVSLSNNDTKG